MTDAIHGLARLGDPHDARAVTGEGEIGDPGRKGAKGQAPLAGQGVEDAGLPVLAEMQQPGIANLF